MQDTKIDYFQRRQAWRTGIGLRLRLLERWARTHALIEPENAGRIARILTGLKSDTLSLGFVGEISRGKSELINAIFFGADSHPVLPVGPGPTTLCPTEIRFQAQSTPSLQLLPIQTTEDPRPLLAWQEQPESWTHVELAADNPGQVTEALLRITLTQAQESLADQSNQETKQSAVLHTPARALAVRDRQPPASHVGTRLTHSGYAGLKCAGGRARARTRFAWNVRRAGVCAVR